MENIPTINHKNLVQLRIRWLVLAIVSTLVLFSVGILLAIKIQHTLGLRWALGSGIVLGYILRTLYRFLEVNKHPEQSLLLKRFGAGTLVTLFRGLLLAALAGCILLPPLVGLSAWIPAALYLLAALSDGVDGYLARKQNHVTVLGEQIDMRLDALGILVATTLGIHYGQLQPWYLLVGGAYYLFTFGQSIRVYTGAPVYKLQPRRYRSVFAGLQMGFLAVTLWPVFSPLVTTLAAYLFGIPLIMIFIRDYLLISGWLNSETGWYTKSAAIMKKAGQNLILPAIRGGVVILSMTYGIVQPKFLSTFLAAVEHSAFLGFISNNAVLTALLVMLFIFIFLGILPRIASLLYVSILASFLTENGYHQIIALTMMASLIPVIFGGGRLSLFPWEERFLYPSNSSKKKH